MLPMAAASTVLPSLPSRAKYDLLHHFSCYQDYINRAGVSWKVQALPFQLDAAEPAWTSFPSGAWVDDLGASCWDISG